MRQFATDQRPLLSLDDPVVLANAKSDPVGFVRNLEGAVIDEIQRAPELMLVIKQSVDTNTAPGQFLLTGSANVVSLPTIGDSLAGRTEIIEFFPFAQAELLGRKGDAIDRPMLANSADRLPFRQILLENGAIFLTKMSGPNEPKTVGRLGMGPLHASQNLGNYWELNLVFSDNLLLKARKLG